MAVSLIHFFSPKKDNQPSQICLSFNDGVAYYRPQRQRLLIILRDVTILNTLDDDDINNIFD